MLTGPWPTYSPAISTLPTSPLLLTQFQEGASVGISDMAHSRTHTRLVKKLCGFDKGLKKLECDKKPAAIASGVEFILEGLHLNRKLNKVTAQSGEISYEA